METGRNHRVSGGKGMWYAPCHIPLPSGDIRKRQVIVSVSVLQEGVLFYKSYFAVFRVVFGEIFTAQE